MGYQKDCLKTKPSLFHSNCHAQGSEEHNRWCGLHCRTFFFLKKRAELDFKRFDELSQSQTSLVQIINGVKEIKVNNSQRKNRWKWNNRLRNNDDRECAPRESSQNDDVESLRNFDHM